MGYNKQKPLRVFLYCFYRNTLSNVFGVDVIIFFLYEFKKYLTTSTDSSSTIIKTNCLLSNAEYIIRATFLEAIKRHNIPIKVKYGLHRSFDSAKYSPTNA